MSYIEVFNELPEDEQISELKRQIIASAQYLFWSPEVSSLFPKRTAEEEEDGWEGWLWNNWTEFNDDDDLKIESYRIEGDSIEVNFSWETSGRTHFVDGEEIEDQRIMTGSAVATIDGNSTEFSNISAEMDGEEPDPPTSLKPCDDDE